MNEEMRNMIDKVKNFNTIVNENQQDNQISNTIKSLTQKYNDEYGLTCELINNGDCMNFAKDLYDNLKNIGIIGEILSNDDFTFLTYDGTYWENNKHELDDYGIKPVNYTSLPDHVWFYYNGKHYDSDAPNGVNDMFELPIIKKFYLEKRG